MSPGSSWGSFVFYENNPGYTKISRVVVLYDLSRMPFRYCEGVLWTIFLNIFVK